jgi:beta-galactosidase
VFGLRHHPFLAVHRPEHHGRAVSHASPWAWPDVVSSWSWAGHEGAPVTVDVYADAEEVELLLDGRSLGRAPAGQQHRFRATFETVYEPGVLEAVARRDGDETGRTSLRSASEPVVLGASVDRTAIRADPSDLAYVSLGLVDREGSIHTTAGRRVTVSVDGPGVLQGLGSASPCTEEGFTATSCTTFDGRALAVVRPTGAGTIVLTASAEGCEPQTVRIEARG